MTDFVVEHPIIKKEEPKIKPSVIAVRPNVKKGLDDLKVHPRETYNQVIERLIKLATVQTIEPILLTGKKVSKELQELETPVESEEPVPEKNSPDISDEPESGK